MGGALKYCCIKVSRSCLFSASALDEETARYRCDGISKRLCNWFLLLRLNRYEFEQGGMRVQALFPALMLIPLQFPNMF